MRQTTNYGHLLAWTRPELVTADNYDRLCTKLEKLTAYGGTNPRGPLGKMIDLLSRLISDYETENLEVSTVTGVEMLRHIIDSRNETQAEFARAMGVRPQIISNVLNGHRAISKGFALRLAKALHMNPGVFLAQCATPRE